MSILVKFLKSRHALCVSLLLAIASNGLCQNIDNELFIIKNTHQYRAWNLASPEKGLVKLAENINPFYTNIVYSTRQNFTGKILYKNPQLYLVEEAALALQRVQDSLKKAGLSILLYDAYRPYDVTVAMWKVVPDERYAANPARGSGHNRGIAVDLTLADLATGKPLEMPTGYDNFSDTAHHNFKDLPENVLKNRSLLKGVMEHFGFNALSTEWWHYSLPQPQRYPLLNLSFRGLRRYLR